MRLMRADFPIRTDWRRRQADQDSGLDHGAIKLGDAYLADVVPKITGSAAWREGRAW